MCFPSPYRGSDPFWCKLDARECGFWPDAGLPPRFDPASSDNNACEALADALNMINMLNKMFKKCRNV